MSNDTSTKETETKLKTVEIPEVSANAAAVEWPTDRQGVSTALKREILRAAGRVNGREDKVMLVLEAMKVGMGHVIARYKAQIESQKTVNQSKLAREAREAKVLAARKAAAIRVAEANLASLKDAE